MFAEGDGPQGAGPCWDGTVQHLSWGALTADAARAVAADDTTAVQADETTSGANKAAAVAADETTSTAKEAAAVSADGAGAGAGASFGVGVLAAVARPVGQVLVEGVSDASRVLARTVVTAMSAPRCAERELLDGLGALDTLAARVARVMVTVLVEAHRRGLHLDTGLSVQDWVAGRCPGLSTPQVGELSTVVKAWDSPGHGSIRNAVAGGDVSVARAARLLRALTRVAPVTDTATYAQVVDLLVPVAAQGSDKDLRTVTDHLIAVALADKETEAKAQACHDSRGIHESSLAGGSLTRFILTADAQGAATIRAILGSPLAGPAPDATGPDPRTPTQRR